MSVFSNLKNEFQDQENEQDQVVVDYSRKQTITSAERSCLYSLLVNLKENGVSCEVGIQEKLVIPLQKRKKSEIEIQQLASISRRYEKAEFTIRCPDILIEKFGLAIELDGSAHDNIDNRVARDNTREVEYRQVGIDVLVIKNEQLLDGKTRAAIFRDIIRHVKNEQKKAEFKRFYQLRRKNISRARKAFKRKFDSIDIGSFNRKAPLVKCTSVHWGRRQWGGFRIAVGKGAPKVSK